METQQLEERIQEDLLNLGFKKQNKMFVYRSASYQIDLKYTNHKNWSYYDLIINEIGKDRNDAETEYKILKSVMSNVIPKRMQFGLSQRNQKSNTFTLRSAGNPTELEKYAKSFIEEIIK